MSARVAVLLVHGMGSQGPGFGTGFAAAVERRVAEATGRADAVVFAGAHWAPVLQDAEADLLRRTTSAARLGWSPLRAFAVHFLADAAAYAETPRDRTVYDRVHGVLAAALRDLARAAGPTAPLVVVAHSLGTWISSNALYDLGELPDRDLRGAPARAASNETPLERGETLVRFYTLGSPLALFALRYPDYGRPIQVPSPRLATTTLASPGAGGTCSTPTTSSPGRSGRSRALRGRRHRRRPAAGRLVPRRVDPPRPRELLERRRRPAPRRGGSRRDLAPGPVPLTSRPPGAGRGAHGTATTSRTSGTCCRSACSMPIFRVIVLLGQWWHAPRRRRRTWPSTNDHVLEVPAVLLEEGADLLQEGLHALLGARRGGRGTGRVGHGASRRDRGLGGAPPHDRPRPVVGRGGRTGERRGGPAARGRPPCVCVPIMPGAGGGSGRSPGRSRRT